MRRASLLIAFAASFFAAGAARAACSITTTSVAFGAYDPRSATADTGVGSIRLDCHPSDTPVIAIGTGGSGSYAQRRMTNGVSTLNYNLYTSSLMNIVWGNGTGGTVTVAAPKRISTTTIYGRIPAGQNVSAGAYNDTLIVTVNF